MIDRPRPQANGSNRPRPCENGWSRGVERPRVSAVPSAGVQVFEPLWWLDGSRVRAVLTSNGGTALEATFSQRGLRLDCCDQRSGHHDVDDAGEIVGEHVQRHFGGDAWQRLHQEMGCSHPRLDYPEGMLDRLAPLAHFFRMLVEPALHGLENMLMLSSRDPSLLAGGAAVFDGAARAGIGPIAAQHQPVFFVGVAVGETFTCRTDVEILTGHVAEVLLAEAPIGLGVRSHRLWQSDCNAGFLARQDLRAVEVASTGDDIEALLCSVSLVCLATPASCDRSLPTLVTSCVTIR